MVAACCLLPAKACERCSCSFWPLFECNSKVCCAAVAHCRRRLLSATPCGIMPSGSTLAGDPPPLHLFCIQLFSRDYIGCCLFLLCLLRLQYVEAIAASSPRVPLEVIRASSPRTAHVPAQHTRGAAPIAPTHLSAGLPSFTSRGRATHPLLMAGRCAPCCRACLVWPCVQLYHVRDRRDLPPRVRSVPRT